MDIYSCILLDTVSFSITETMYEIISSESESGVVKEQVSLQDWTGHCVDLSIHCLFENDAGVYKHTDKNKETHDTT